MDAAGLTVSTNGWVAVVWLPSVTWMVKLEETAVVGWPTIRPVAAVNVRPTGRLPAVTDQV